MTQDPAIRLAQISVLIADNDPRVAMIVRKVLESLGFSNLHLASDGQKALQFLNTKKINMVITDWQMSPMDGITLVKYLRTNNESPNRFIPIIMLTANTERSQVETARDVGVTEFVAKPFTANALCDRIVNLIDNPRSFILSHSFSGPDRRRRRSFPPEGTERRK